MTSALEGIKTIDLEEWLTLATAPSPTKLKQGQSPNMLNVWVDEKPGSVITAEGFKRVGRVPSNQPVTFCIDFFNSSTGVHYFVCSDNGNVWTTQDFQTFTYILGPGPSKLNTAFQLRGMVIRNKLWLTNGSDPIQVTDGVSVSSLSDSKYPRARYIAYHDERVWLYHTSSNRSAVYFSSLTDSSGTLLQPDDVNAWDMTDNFLQVSEGDSDFGTGMMIYRGYLFLFKQYSIWRLVGYDEYTYSRVKTRASTGTRFNESLQILDNLVHLIGIDGIYVFDGEETERISDIIDPATASQTAFGFDDLQQPNTNNQFWETTLTADWNAGTKSANLSASNELIFGAADDSQSDFQAGTLTNVDATTNPGSLQLSLVSSGGGGTLISTGKTGTVSVPGGGGMVGLNSYITDGNTSNYVGGYRGNATSQDLSWQVDLGASYAVGRVIIRGYHFERSNNTATFEAFVIEGSANGSSWNSVATVSHPSVVRATGGIFYDPALLIYQVAAVDITTDFSTAAYRYWRFRHRDNGVSYSVIKELEIYQAGFQPTGNFISKTLDLGTTPTSLGNFNATVTLNDGTATFYTQSSSDGSAWDARLAVTNGGAIASTVKRYLRWQVDFTYGDLGVSSPVIDAVYLPALYLSAIHDTGGSIFAWGPFEADDSTLGQLITFYYRTATTSGGISATGWTAISPGGVISDAVGRQYVQFKIEFGGGTDSSLPSVTSVTINWVTGTVGQPPILQNVASASWRNRYWLSAAGPGATSNDTILIRGKKTFGSPWMLKDWEILSFSRYFDSFYGGSSTAGDIWKLDTGYAAKAGDSGVEPLDSFFETGDFIFGGFAANFIELDVEVERVGSWTLAIGWSVDNGNTWTEATADLTLKDFDNNYIKRINLNVTSTRIRFRFRTNGVDTPFQVHRCIVYYKLETERGSIRGDYLPA